ncbi:MAG: hypothetical protein EBY62_02770 [Cellvibrionales bacterium]|nr:hypothetical protein [Cellvibrionales bacterium]
MKPFERAVLHIGGEKTGSTSLQHRLDLSRELLEQQGFYQPTTGAHAGNCWGFAAIGQYHPKHSMHHQMTQATKSHEEAVEELINAYKAELANARAKCDTLLVSSEHLQTVVDLRGIRRLLEWLATIAKQIDVVYVIRRQDQIIQSLFSTALRNGALMEPLVKHKTIARMENKRLNHWTAITQYLAFPYIVPITIKPVRYRPPSDADAFEEELSDALGIPSNLPRSMEQKNLSLDADAVRFLATLTHPEMRNEIQCGSNQLGEIIDTLEKTHNGRKFDMPNHWAREAMLPFGLSNQRTSQAFLDDGYPLFTEEGFRMYPRMDSLTIAMSRDEFFGFISQREGLRETYGELSMGPTSDVFDRIKDLMTISSE